MDNFEKFMDLAKRGKFLMLNDVWAKTSIEEKNKIRQEIYTLETKLFESLRKTLSSSNKKLFSDLFDHKIPTKQTKMKSKEVVKASEDVLEGMNKEDIEKFDYIKGMLQNCKDNKVMINLFAKKIAKYPDIKGILPLIKDIDESIYEIVLNEVENNGKNDISVAEDLREDLLDDEMSIMFVEENIVKCTMKARILSEYYKELIIGGVDKGIIESLMIQESHIIEDTGLQGDNNDFFNEDMFENDDDDFDEDDDDDDNEF